ncbi:MAG: cytochrome C oxidase subunit IV family protein [Candidatus Rokubacteria bacterium]|nr:cytochrome C oxidase subunit IV family protein [Candidatus Rokubacteria bacterium]MBI3826773.1 cytochrome C oxidase subunit IV family protein [Candidatus Rokubacteria bacterium]
MSAPPHDHPGQEHASVSAYVKIAVILSLVTALEFASIYIRQLTPILIPLLLVMSAAKFALVVLFFMHLRYDARALSVVFVGSLVIASVIGVALMTLTGEFLVFTR